MAVYVRKSMPDQLQDTDSFIHFYDSLSREMYS